MAKRIISIDILRGIAVLQMIVWQIFDFFAKTDIYSDVPYYIPFFNMPIHGTGLALFAFASGASVYISVTRRLKKNVRIKDVILHSIKRYGGYILLSLVFTSFVFGFRIFYTWREVVQGIGLAALIAAILILICKSGFFYFTLALLIAFVQPFLRMMLENSFVSQIYPLEPISFGIVSNGVSIFLNATVRGFFSLTHVLPMLLFGVLLSILIIRLHGKQLIKTSFLIGFLLSFISIGMHFSFNKIDVYNWSPAYQIGFMGFSFLLFSAIEYVVLHFKGLRKGRIAGFFSLFGRTAIIAYLLHFVVIYKPLKVFNVESTLNQPISYILAIVSIIFVYYSCKIWLLTKDNFFKWIRKKTRLALQ